jgi:hypothetical protein
VAGKKHGVEYTQPSEALVFPPVPEDAISKIPECPSGVAGVDAHVRAASVVECVVFAAARENVVGPSVHGVEVKVRPYARVRRQPASEGRRRHLVAAKSPLASEPASVFDLLNVLAVFVSRAEARKEAAAGLVEPVPGDSAVLRRLSDRLALEFWKEEMPLVRAQDGLEVRASGLGIGVGCGSWLREFGWRSPALAGQEVCRPVPI